MSKQGVIFIYQNFDYKDNDYDVNEIRM